MKNTPTPPPPPDPTQVSKAQESSNVGTAASQAALNNVNQITPYGSNTFDQTGTYVNDQGVSVPQYTENTTLTPELQAILGQRQDISSGVLNKVLNQVPNLNVGGINTSTPFSGLLNMPPTTVNPSQVNLSANAPISGISPENVSPLSPVATQHVNALGPVQTTDAIDTKQYNNDVMSAIYGQQKGFLDPIWSQREQQLNDQLSQQGITAESNPTAYNQAMTQFNNSRTQAYQSAQDSATSQGAQFGNLAAALAVQQNQNLFGQRLSANENQFGQNVTAADTNFGQDVTANQNQFGQNITASNTDFGQQMQSEANLFEQMLQRGSTQFGQEMANNQNQFSQGWANQSNLFNLALAGQQQNISQQLTQQNQPINLLTQLLGGAPNLQTQGQVTPASTSVAPTDVTGAYALSQQAAMQNYQAKLASQNAMFGGLAGIGGSILGASTSGGGTIAASLLGM